MSYLNKSFGDCEVRENVHLFSFGSICVSLLSSLSVENVKISRAIFTTWTLMLSGSSVDFL